ncbi:nitrate reductase [Dictyobacter aurantiacus]|uniref:Nitrate reductase n=2 Tax=Dictyobacter aurantiacus TaxID=1936993 RepID=A0A401Z844_9CHLR|nr:solute carrier family 23 protein [Dictyobacter aurantiacus]GCE03005.1 nitrate reductase [Dictyobacter aurantiacus]
MDSKTRYFPRWKVNTSGGIVAPDERLPWGPSLLLGFQHVLAMFGSTVVAPLLMGFPPNTAILFSGIGTLIFFLFVGGRVPSYVGSSFAFLGVVATATGHPLGTGPNPNISVALGGIIAAGVVYAIIAIAVLLAGYRWLDYLMPPVVTGTVVMVIGLNLSVSAIKQAATTSFDAWMALVTIIAVALVSVYAPGLLRRLPILIGGIVGYVVYALFGLAGIGPRIDFTQVSKAAWIGLPQFSTPVFHTNAISIIAPVAIILAAENIGHIKAVGAMTGHNLDKYLGRAFLGDSVATILAGSFGGTGVTTYAENIGVMAVNRVYSTLIFVIASCIAILFGFCPKFGAVVGTIPSGVFGGLSIVLFGLIAVTGGRIWIENRVDFSKSSNLIPAGVALVIGAGMTGGLAVQFGTIAIDGIGLATFASIILYQILKERNSQPDEAVFADAAVGTEPASKPLEEKSSN